mgnify:CR=1 FL=1
MCQIALNIPEEVLYDIKMSKLTAEREARKIVALQFYTVHGVSLGYCAQIAGMDKEDFIHYLSINNVSIFQFDDKEEFIEEMNNA